MHYHLRNLYNLFGVQLAQAFASIPNTVTTLNLDTNFLYQKTGAELAQAFASIPNTVATLNLSNNILYRKTGAELAQAFASIPNTVITLSLAGNGLDQKTGDELAIAFEGIPNTVTALDLGCNDLYRKTSAELAIAFANIPHTVTTLNFRNDFLAATKTQQKEILLFLPSSIKTIILNDREYQPQEYLLNQLFPITSRVNYHLKEGAIQPKFDIDESTLVRIISYFQKHPSSIGYLVCGLLLDGRIANTVNEEKAKLQWYMDNRTLAAIAFYRKAACDSKLQHKIEHIAWLSHTMHEDNVAIKQALDPYRLRPVDSSYPALQENTKEDLLNFADYTQNPLPSVDAIFNEQIEFNPSFKEKTDLNSLDSFWWLLKIGLAISLASAAMLVLCFLNTSLVTATIGAAVVTTITYAACSFFGKPLQNNDGLNQSNSPQQSGIFNAIT